MNEGLEFHDSLVRTVELCDGSLQIDFSGAYIHRSPGRPGIEDGEGYVQPASLVFTGARCSGNPAALQGRLSDGSLFINGTAVQLVPVPSSGSGNVWAEFVFENGAVLTVEADSFECSSYGEARFVERYVALYLPSEPSER